MNVMDAPEKQEPGEVALIVSGKFGNAADAVDTFFRFQSALNELLTSFPQLEISNFQTNFGPPAETEGVVVSEPQS